MFGGWNSAKFTEWKLEPAGQGQFDNHDGDWQGQKQRGSIDLRLSIHKNSPFPLNV